MRKLLIIFTVNLVFFSCSIKSEHHQRVVRSHAAVYDSIINPGGQTILTRFNVPKGFIRTIFDTASFQSYLRNLPLKPVGAKVKYFDGSVKTNEVYDGVFDLEIGNRDLHQCADAVMRLRADYFFSKGLYDSIYYKLTNGFVMSYSKWRQGFRLIVNGNNTEWRKVSDPSGSYEAYREYLDVVYMYAGTLSLSRSMRSKSVENISIGDVFIVGGSPGHAVIVVDLAVNESGEKIFMLAQSYMPAQDIQVLKNLNEPEISPWYRLPEESNLSTPEWSFTKDQLKTW